MLLDNLIQSQYFWLLAGVAILIARLASIRYQSGLNKFNGPFIASFTNFWRLGIAYWYPDRVTYVPLPAKYGKIIRYGPRTILFATPEAIKDIYTAGMRKSTQYTVAAGVSKGVVVPNMFSTIDKERHGKLRRAVSNAFALSSLIQYEPLVNETVKTFLHQIDVRFAGKDKVVDFTEWTRFFALDVVGQLTYTKPLGMLESGRDNLGVVDPMHKIVRYFSVVYNNPWVDRVLWKNPGFLWLGRKGIYNRVTPTVPFAHKQVSARMESIARQEKQGSSEDKNKVDLLAKFLRAKDDFPEVVTDNAVLGLTLSMVNAGSDTVATTIAACFYYLLHQPEKMRKLQQEIDSYFPPPATLKSGSLEEFNVPFSESQKLPYLDACIKETFRFHPALGGQLLERMTPPEGATICGEYIPGDTIVACNAWIVQRYKPVFGDDADNFRPERWLECSKEHASLMNRSLLTFGAGPNTCVGKNIALLELYKVIPTFIRAFEVQLNNPNESCKINNLGVVEQYDFFVRFKPRYQK